MRDFFLPLLLRCRSRGAAAAPKLDVVGKIFLAEAPVFESFYTVPFHIKFHEVFHYINVK